MEVLGRGWREMDGTVVGQKGVERKAVEMGFKSFCRASLAWRKEKNHSITLEEEEEQRLCQ